MKKLILSLSVEPEGLSVQLTYIMDHQEENALWETHKNVFNKISFQGLYNSGNHQVILIAQDTNENPFSSRKGTVLAAGYVDAWGNWQRYTWSDYFETIFGTVNQDVKRKMYLALEKRK